jgi:hypothetical protein
LAVSASETAVSTTVLAERDQPEAGFLPAIFQGFDTRPERLELLSFELIEPVLKTLAPALDLKYADSAFPSRCAFVNSS